MQNVNSRHHAVWMLQAGHTQQIVACIMKYTSAAFGGEYFIVRLSIYHVFRSVQSWIKVADKLYQLHIR